YCSYCYINGEFTNPEVTNAKEMQALVYKKMTEQGMWAPVAWLCTLMIPNLKRWKSS
ncbi:MAG: zinc ribbon domain-containing protein, partial [Brevinema sp.]